MDKYIDLDLLLIGKTGNGKSSTGNSILMRRKFKKGSAAQSVTSVIKQEFSQYKGYTIKVVDTPGVGENRLENVEAVKLVTKQLKQAMLMNPEGYHAFLIVIKYGNRFTGEEKATIEFLKDFFGPNFVKDFCILVMSNGDGFASDNEDEKISFESWYKQQGGALKELLMECKNRIVLFDNNTKSQRIQEEQLDNLLSLVLKLNDGIPYSDKHFEEARKTRDSLMVKTKSPIIQKEISKETSLIILMLEKIQSSVDEESNKVELHKLKERCGKLLELTESKDKGTKVLSDILDSIKSLKTTIEAEIGYNERNKNEREETRRRHEEKIEEMNREFQKCLLQSREEDKKMYEIRMKEIQANIEKENKEREAREEKYKQDDLEIRRQLIKQREESERKYQQATDKSNESVISKSIDWLVTPFKATANYVASFLPSR